MQDFLGTTTTTTPGIPSSTPGAASREGSDGMISPSFTWRSRRVDDAQAKRHRTDFEILELLGSGGFGRVYKARNKLDHKCYALKVVPMPHNNNDGGGQREQQDSSSSLELQRVLREVQVLSGIPSHDHVVRYYASWVEETRGDDLWPLRSGDSDGESWGFGAGGSGSSAPETPSAFGYSDSCYDSCISGNNRKTSSSATDAADAESHHRGGSSSGGRRPVCHLCQSSYDDWEVGLEYWGLIDSVLQPLDLCVDCYKESLPEHVDTSKMTIREAKPYQKKLYILMEYCDSTMEETIRRVGEQKHRRTNRAMDQTSEDDFELSEENIAAAYWSFFRQSVKGIAHLHANGIVHRDIKPNNVFLVNNNNSNNRGLAEGIVKIGDLGLAIHHGAPANNNNKNPLRGIGSNSNSKSDDDVAPETKRNTRAEQSAGVGTYLYRAPEIDTGNYDEKCDVYSLGVLLVELFGNFETAMERAKILGGLKGGFPENNNNNNNDHPRDTSPSLPFHIRLAHRMIAANPRQRPSCSEILDEVERFCQARFLRNLPSDSTSSTALAKELSRANALLREKDQEIARLRKLLREHGISCEENTI